MSAIEESFNQFVLYFESIELYQIMDQKDDNLKRDGLEEKYNHGNDADGIIDHLTKLDGVSDMLGTD